MEALRISPNFTADDWMAFNEKESAHSPKAIEIVKDRLNGRFLHFADKCLGEDFSGFVVLSIDCLLVGSIQQSIDGVQDGRNRSSGASHCPRQGEVKRVKLELGDSEAGIR